MTEERELLEMKPALWNQKRRGVELSCTDVERNTLNVADFSLVLFSKHDKLTQFINSLCS